MVMMVYKVFLYMESFFPGCCSFNLVMVFLYCIDEEERFALFDRKINPCKSIQIWEAGRFENDPCLATERNILTCMCLWSRLFRMTLEI
jgi:hypothetical protein